MKDCISFLTFALAVSYLLGCEESNPTNNGATNELIPLKLGNSWVNIVSVFDSNMVVTRTSVDSLWVSGDTTLNGEKYFMISIKSRDSGGILYLQHDVYLARNTLLGYEQLRGGFITASYRYPVMYGDSMVISREERVTVPAGTYNCIVYKFVGGETFVDSTYQTVYGKRYICPNIGIVKEEFSFPRSNYGYSSVLSRATRN